MRVRPVYLVISLSLVALSAPSQALPRYERPAQDNTFSIFVYDRLGATPTIRTPRAARTDKAITPPATADETRARSDRTTAQTRTPAAPSSAQ